ALRSFWASSLSLFGCGPGRRSRRSQRPLEPSRAPSQSELSSGGSRKGARRLYFYYVAPKARRLFLFGEVQSPCTRSSVAAPVATGSKREPRSPSIAEPATTATRSSSTRSCCSPTAFACVQGPHL